MDPSEAVGDRTPALGHAVQSKDAAVAAQPSAAADGLDEVDREDTVEEEEQAKEELLESLKRPEFDDLIKRAKAAEAAKQAAGGGVALSSAAGSGAAVADRKVPNDKMAKVTQLAAAMGLVSLGGDGAGGGEGGAKETKDHRFWSTQPVPKYEEEVAVTTNGPLEVKTIEEVRKEPLGLPAGYEWCTLDVTTGVELTEVYELLAANYVEDDDNMFRFNYSAQFLTWALTPPGYYKDWHVGVRVTKTKRLVACITGVPADMVVYGSQVKLCEINFLCVDKKLRSKRLAPVLIKEVTRRVNLEGIWQAAYTAGVVLPKPVASCRYWHRSIDPKKLIEVGFSRLPPKMTMQRMQRLYKLPDAPKTARMRKMEARDVPSASKGLRTNLDKFNLHPHLSEDDFRHWLMPREGVINAYVVEDDAGNITDLVSFYHLPSTVIGNLKHKDLRAAYLYYYFATSVPLDQLIEDGLVCARDAGIDVFNCLDLMDNGVSEACCDAGIDVFNCLDLMDNGSFLTKLKFGVGDGNLQYYLYNWACPQMEPPAMGLVLL